eukprot:gene18043-18280_t
MDVIQEPVKQLKLKQAIALSLELVLLLFLLEQGMVYKRFLENQNISFGPKPRRRLREHRSRLGLALEYVAKAVGIPVEDLTQYEYGKKPITQEELQKLANLYG